MVVLQISLHKQTLTTFEELLPHIDKQLGRLVFNTLHLSFSLSHTRTHTHTQKDVSTERPVYGLDLLEHLKITERTISYVIEECCLALREKSMNTEGLFRIAGSAAKLKLLKVLVSPYCQIIFFLFYYRVHLMLVVWIYLDMMHTL